MKIYVASSWRNIYQPKIVNLLREHTHEVYDFRNPKPENYGFSWKQVSKDWQSGEVPLQQYLEMLKHPIAEEGFYLDFSAMEWADACVLVLPAGRSANIEAGWFVGAGKLLIVYIPEPIEPDLMYKMADKIVTTEKELINAL